MLSRRHLIALAQSTAVTCICLLHIFVPSRLGLLTQLLAASIGAVAVVAGIRYLTRARARLPFFEYGLLQAYVVWALPAVGHQARLGPSLTGLETAVFTAVVAVAFYVISWFAAKPAGQLAGPLVSRALPRGFPHNVTVLMIILLFMAALINSGAYRVLPRFAQQAVATMGSYTIPLVYLSVAVFWNNSKKHLPILIAGMLLVSLAGLSTGMLKRALLPALVVLVVYMIARRSFPWRWALALIVVVVAVQPAKMVYRSSVYDGDVSTVYDTVNAWVTAFQQTWVETDRSQIQDNLDSLSHRLNQLDKIAATVDLCPSVIPHEYGRNWPLIPLALIPRILYPSKPDFNEVFANRYNITFGFQSARTTDTTVMVMPLVADGYWNFGLAGVALTGFLVGALASLLAHAIPITSWAGLTIGASYLVTFHSHRSLDRQFGTLFQTFVGLAISITLVLVWSRTASRHLQSPRSSVESRSRLKPASRTAG